LISYFKLEIPLSRFHNRYMSAFADAKTTVYSAVPSST
jgi:hypothetical protein